MKKVLVGTLGVAAFLEAALTVPAFVSPPWMLQQFKVAVTDDAIFLSGVLSWMLLWVTLTCLLALKWVRKDRPEGWTLSLALGAWWILIGISLAWRFGRTEHLVLDSAKGALICISAWMSKPRT